MADISTRLAALERAVEHAHAQVELDSRHELLRAATCAAGSGPVRTLVERMLASADPGRRVLALQLAITMSPVSDETQAWAREQGLRLSVGEWFRGEDREAIVRLMRAELEGTDDPAIVELAIYAVGHMELPELVDAVLRHAGDEDPDVREACTWTLFGLEEELSQPSIDALVTLARDPVAVVRDWATFGLGASGPVDTPVARAVYRANLEDPDEDVQWEATMALALLGDVEMLVVALVHEWLDVERGVRLARELGDPRLHRPLLELREADRSRCGEGEPAFEALLDAAIAACRR